MKICPRCRRRYANTETSCTDDGQKLFPLWYSWIRIWHFGVLLIGIGMVFGYLGVVNPVIDARAHDITTIYISPALIIPAPLLIALGVPFLFGFSGLTKMETMTKMRVKKAILIVVFLGVFLTVILVVVLEHLGYPL